MPTRTKATTITKGVSIEDVKNPPPKSKNGEPSSEVSLDEIFKLAREVDQAAQAEPEEKPKRGKRKKAVEPPEPELPPAPVIVTDPEFEAMIQWGIGSGVDFCKLKLDWNEPGLHWRNKTAVLVGRLWQRLQPMSESWVTDIITLGGYAALWVIPNVSSGGGAGPASDRNNGNRKDIQDEGIVKSGA